jgi:hypothetical protein
MVLPAGTVRRERRTRFYVLEVFIPYASLPTLTQTLESYVFRLHGGHRRHLAFSRPQLSREVAADWSRFRRRGTQAAVRES